MVTQASQWKHTVEITLPSGHTVEIRPLGYDLVLQCETLPDVITSMVVKAFKGEAVSPDINELKQAQEYIAFLDTCCTLCFVHPRIVELPEGEDEISIEALEFDDKVEVFSFFGKSRRWLELFRAEQIKNVPSGGAEPGHGAATEQTAQVEEALAS